MLTCDHEKRPGHTRCQVEGCPANNAAYLRQRRDMLNVRALRKARHEGAAAFQMLVVSRFESDLAGLMLDGRAFAELVRAFPLP